MRIDAKNVLDVVKNLDNVKYAGCTDGKLLSAKHIFRFVCFELGYRIV